MKRFGVCSIQTIVLIGLLALSAASALAQDRELFDSDFCASVPECSLGVSGMLCLDGTLYGLAGDALYAWMPGEEAPGLYASLPPHATFQEEWWFRMRKSQLSEKELAALSAPVDGLAVGEDALWGYNLYSGRFGKVTRDGIDWEGPALETSCFFRDDSVMQCMLVRFACVAENRLYLFVEQSDSRQVEPKDDAHALLVYDLSTGAYQSWDTQNARSICLYKPGFFLLARPGTKTTMTLSTLNMATGAVTDLPLRIPFGDSYGRVSGEGVGGLAYDSERDRIVFAINRQVWCSEKGEPFRACASLPRDTFILCSTPAWILPDGDYAIETVCRWYIRTLQ